MTLLHLLRSLAIATSLAFAGAAHAGPANGAGQGPKATAAPPAASYCSAGTPTSAGMSMDQVTFSGRSADDCYGIVQGNDQKDTINTLDLDWGSDWTFLTKDDGELVGGAFAGVDFQLEADGLGQGAGRWTLTATGGTLPVVLDFVAVLKASNQLALWFFDDMRVGASEGGAWSSVFLNGNHQLHGLSHMSLYVRQGAAPTTGDAPPAPSPAAVPEPSALALAALALIAAGAARRRRA